MLRALDLLGRYYLDHSTLIRGPSINRHEDLESDLGETGSNPALVSESESESEGSTSPSGSGSGSGSSTIDGKTEFVNRSSSTPIRDLSDRDVEPTSGKNIVSPYFASKIMKTRRSTRDEDLNEEILGSPQRADHHHRNGEKGEEGVKLETKRKRDRDQARPISPPITPIPRRKSRRKLDDQAHLPTPESVPRALAVSRKGKRKGVGEANTNLRNVEVTEKKRKTTNAAASASTAKSRGKGKGKEVVVEIPTTRVHGLDEKGNKVLTKDEKGVVEPVGKIHLIQEKLRHDPWKMLVATSLLNVTSGKQARPVLEVLLRRWPTPQIMAEASITDLSQLLYPLGLYNQRASSLIRFSRQYLDLAWPLSTTPTTSPIHTIHAPADESQSLPLSPLPAKLDVKIFHGSGVYASDSFRIFSSLLVGKGGPEDEKRWLDKRTRAVNRLRAQDEMRKQEEGLSGSDDDDERITREEEQVGVEEVGEWMSDDDDGRGEPEVEEWRTVRPKDKELRRYLIWRWGIEGIVYDINTGPTIVKERDKERLNYLPEAKSS